METTFEKLSLFFDKIKTIGFWQRIFGWRQIRSLSYDAYEEFKALMHSLNSVIKETDQTKNSIAVLTNENEHLKSDRIKLESSLESIKKEVDIAREEISELKASIASKEETIRSSGKKINDLEKELTLYKENAENLR